ncbi:MAG TPA: IS630 family transposase [Candidatus Binataceae bacterium]|nr:IS630 family transposase [Candidatus Binataceae bacterium]
MQRTAIVLSRPQRRRLLRDARKSSDAALRTRYMIVLHTAAGKSQSQIAAMLGCSVSTVKRTRSRWRDHGQSGLIDRREDAGSPAKADEAYAGDLLFVLEHSPRQHGERRPTWTQELMIKVMCRRGHVRISRTTMGRLLARLRIRRGMPKPTVGCAWSKRAKNRRIRLIRRLIESLGPDEAAVWEDEIDIHLNPKIGPDWMLPGTQRQVLTPGQNTKRYIAGAMDAQTERLIWVKGDRKHSGLFIALLEKLLKQYPDRKLIHVILDNFKIHSSQQVQKWLTERGQRLRLHFLPPYCPDDNRIERCVWRELHANVTRNHDCHGIEALMDEAEYHLKQRNRASAKRWLRCA